jgi:hypothetical protein
MTGFILSTKWYLFESKSCGYKIEFPQKPNESPQEVNSEIGKLKINMCMYGVPEGVKDDNILYMVSYTEYPVSKVNSDNKQQLESVYKNSMNAAINNVHGKLISEKGVTLKNYVGKEIKVDLKEDKAVVKMQFYLVKNKMYMIQVFTEIKKDSNPSINQFINSFDLILN